MATVIRGKEYTTEELEKAMDALQKQKDRQLAYRKKQMEDPEFKEKQKANNLRRRVTNQLLVLKAKEKGITVTKEEVDKVLRTRKSGLQPVAGGKRK